MNSNIHLVVLFLFFFLSLSYSQETLLVSEGYFEKNGVYVDHRSFEENKTIELSLIKTEGKAEHRCEGSSRVEVFMGRWDLNGDGRDQSVFNCGNYIKVEQPGGGYYSYPISWNWALLLGGVSDTNGVPGCEMVINMGSNIRVIDDRSRRTRDYQVASNWALLRNGINELDGKPGNEIVFNIGYQLKIVSDASGATKNVNINNGSWSILMDCFMDTDGNPGNEAAFNIGSKIKIFRNYFTAEHYYDVGNNWSVLSGGVADTDGKAGNEIAINRGYNILIVCDRANTTRNYNLSPYNWQLIGIFDQNGIAGSEIVFHYYSSSTQYAICDAKGTIYTIK